MSLEAARQWVNDTFRPGNSREGIMQLFQRASLNGVQATVVASTQLTTTKRAYLARWTGFELVTIELSPKHQRDWGLIPQSCLAQMEAKPFRAELEPQRRIALSNIRLDSGAAYDGTQPLTGACSYRNDESETCSTQSCALRVQYFRPDLPRSVTSYWYVTSPVIALQGDLHFEFTPLFSKNNPKTFSGTLVLFMQVLTAQDWRSHEGIRRVSNVATAIVEVT